MSRWKLAERATADERPKGISGLNFTVFKEFLKQCEEANRTGSEVEAPFPVIYDADEPGKEIKLKTQKKALFPIGWTDACIRTGAGERALLLSQVLECNLKNMHNVVGDK